MSDQARHFHIARGQRLHGMIIAGLIGAIGVGALLAGPRVPDNELVALVLLLMAAAQTGFVFYRTRDTGPHMVIDGDGVWFRDWRLPVVPWRHIAEVHQTGIRLQPFVCIELADAQAFFASLDDRARADSRSNRLIRSPRLMIPGRALEATPREIEAAILGGRESARNSPSQS